MLGFVSSTFYIVLRIFLVVLWGRLLLGLFCFLGFGGFERGIFLFRVCGLGKWGDWNWFRDGKVGFGVFWEDWGEGSELGWGEVGFFMLRRVCCSFCLLGCYFFVYGVFGSVVGFVDRIGGYYGGERLFLVYFWFLY